MKSFVFTLLISSDRDKGVPHNIFLLGSKDCGKGSIFVIIVVLKSLLRFVFF